MTERDKSIILATEYAYRVPCQCVRHPHGGAVLVFDMDAYDECYEEIHKLWNRLARLRGYKDSEEMEHDPRPIDHTSHDYGIM